MNLTANIRSHSLLASLPRLYQSHLNVAKIHTEHCSCRNWEMGFWRRYSFKCVLVPSRWRTCIRTLRISFTIFETNLIVHQIILCNQRRQFRPLISRIVVLCLTSSTDYLPQL